MTSIAAQRLLIANVLMYFLQQTAPVVTGLFIFFPAAMFVRPWTIITYMFLHGSITHLLFNMLGLYFFGSRVETAETPCASASRL